MADNTNPPLDPATQPPLDPATQPPPPTPKAATKKGKAAAAKNFRVSIDATKIGATVIRSAGAVWTLAGEIVRADDSRLDELKTNPYLKVEEVASEEVAGEE